LYLLCTIVLICKVTCNARNSWLHSTCFEFYSMPDPTHQPSSSRRAARNQYSQAEHNESLANHLARHNQPVPISLRHPPQVDTCPSRSNKRRHIEFEPEANPIVPLVCFLSFVNLEIPIRRQNDNAPPSPSDDQLTSGRHSPPSHERETPDGLGTLAPTIPRTLNDPLLLGFARPH